MGMTNSLRGQTERWIPGTLPFHAFDAWTQNMKYNAFISYSHDADGQLAPILQTSLHRFAKPWYQLRAVRIFRDQTSLSATPELWGSIEKALADSEYLVFLASPEAASSEWVRKEIEYWLHNKSPESLLILVTDGDIFWDASADDFAWPSSSALPENLKGVFSEEPLYVDLRGVKTKHDLNLSNSIFLNAVADIAATLRHIPKEDIVGEDVRQHRITKRWEWGIGTALILLSALALQYAYQATMQRDFARARELAAHGTLALKTDPQLAFRLAEAAIALKPTLEARRLLWSAFVIPLQASMVGRTGPIVAIAYSKSGATLATAGADHDIYLWNAQNGKLKNRFTGHRLKVTALSFSADDTAILSGSADGTVRLWNVETRQATQADVSVHGIIINAQFDHDASILIFSEDGSVFSWDGTGEATGILYLPNGLAHASASRDGSYLAACRKNNIAVVWNRKTNKLIKALETHKQDIQSISFSADSRWLVTASADGTALVWDLARDRVPIVLTGHHKAVEHATFTPDGGAVITASLDGTVRLWATRSGKEMFMRDIGSPLSHVLLSPELDRFAVVLRDQDKTQVWRRQPQLELFASKVDTTISNFIYSPNGEQLAVGGQDGTVHLVDIRKKNTIRLTGHTGAIDDLMFYSQSKTWLLTSSRDGTVNRWQPPGTTPTHQFTVPAFQNRSASFSSDGSRVLTSSDSELPRVWDTATGEAKVTLVGVFNSYLKDMAVTKGGQRIASVDSTDHLRLWKGSDGALLNDALTPKAGDILLMEISPDNRYLVVGTSAGDLRLWTISNGKHIADLPHDGKIVLHVTFSEDGKLMATAAEDEAVRIWRLDKRELVSKLEEQIDQLTDLQFSPLGTDIATAANKGDIGLWDLRSGRRIAMLVSGITHLVKICYSPGGEQLAAASSVGGGAHISGQHRTST